MPRRNINHEPLGSAAAREIGSEDQTIEAPAVEQPAANEPPPKREVQRIMEDLEGGEATRVENLPDDAVEYLDLKPPLEQRNQHAQQQAQERAKIKAEFAHMQRSEALDAAAKYDAHKQRQATDLRRREVKLQNDISALGFWDLRKKRELKRQLTVTTERLNGLTQSTSEMRRLERRKAVASELQDTVPDSRPKHIQARDQMHTAAAKRDSIGFFGRLFGGRKKGKAQADVYGAAARYAKEYRSGEGEVVLSDAEVAQLHQQLDQIDGEQKNAA